MDTLKQLTDKAQQLEGELRILKQAIENRSKAKQPDPAPWQVWDFADGKETLLVADAGDGDWVYTEVGSNGWGIVCVRPEHMTYKRTIDPMKGVDNDMSIL